MYKNNVRVVLKSLQVRAKIYVFSLRAKIYVFGLMAKIYVFGLTIHHEFLDINIFINRTFQSLSSK